MTASDVLRGDLIIVDVYGDGKALRVFENTDAAWAAINRWRALDEQFIAGVEPADWLPFEDFMDEAWIKSFTTDTINL